MKKESRRVVKYVYVVSFPGYPKDDVCFDTKAKAIEYKNKMYYYSKKIYIDKVTLDPEVDLPNDIIVFITQDDFSLEKIWRAEDYHYEQDVVYWDEYEGYHSQSKYWQIRVPYDENKTVAVSKAYVLLMRKLNEEESD